MASVIFATMIVTAMVSPILATTARILLVQGPVRPIRTTDGEGDICDNDDDGDGVLDAVPDNCPLDANFNQTDTNS